MKRIRLIVGLLVLLLLITVLPSAFAAPSAQAGTRYGGKVVTTYSNCGSTQVIGVVLDQAGNPKPGVTVKMWWNGPGGGDVRPTRSGTYVRPETNAAGWDFVLNPQVVANTWYVAIIDDSGNQLSEPVAFQTDGHCGEGAANTVKVEFREGAATAPAPSNPAPAPSSPQPVTDAPSSNAEPAPAIASGATCQTISETGFRLCDDANAEFLSVYRRYGPQNIGYPISTRFKRDGFITQAFQKAILQWRPESDSVALVNVFDELGRAGMNQRLFDGRQTPYELPAGWEGANVPFEQAVQMRQALLDERPALRQAYFAASDPLLFFGLPTSEVEDMGNHYAIRLQRAVLQEWKEAVPWARAGEVTIANGGDIAKELGHLPAFALTESGAVAAVPPAPQPIPVSNPNPPAPAPSSSEPARNLDSRLDALGVSITPASVVAGQPYWRVVEIIWHDRDESGERHSIYVDVMDESGGRVVGQPVTFAWGTGSVQLLVEPKPYPEYGVNFPMYNAGCSYSVVVGGLPSDRVNCLGLGTLGPTREWRTDHVEYLIKYQKAIK